MKYLLICFVLLCTNQAYAYGYENASSGVQELKFEVGKYVGFQYDAYLGYDDPLSEEKLAYYTAIYHKYRFYKTGNFSLFWNNRIDGKSTTSQYRYVSWWFEMGAKINIIEVFGAHHSEHMLERPNIEHYPLSNMIGIRFNLLK